MSEYSLPQCVGFIMDGNRRWADSHGVPSLAGHKAGYEALKALIRSVHKERVPHMVCYAFSTENWKRSTDEVNYLMDLMQNALSELVQSFHRDHEKINVRIIGELERLPPSLRAEIAEAETKNISDPELTVWVAISYGGRAEILDAVNRAMEKARVLTEKAFEEYLWTGKMPDPDIIVRTGGERRLSNFLLWKASYSELFFTDTLWPDFGESEFQSILDEYATRQRRRGA